MKRFFKFMGKFFVVSLCVVFLSVAALAYKPGQAIRYARGHWNDGKGLCAEFASDCLIEGEIRFSPGTDRVGGRTTLGSRGYYYRGCWGLFHDLAARRSEITTYELRTDGYGRIRWDDAYNKGKVKPGDILFIKDLHPDDVTDTYSHVVIVGDRVCDFVTMYGHNNNRNNEVLSVGKEERWICAHFK